MSTLPFPAPECPGPHKPGQRLLRWQHTKPCREAAGRRVKRNGDPIPVDDGTLAGMSVVERGRAVGGL